jgi:hypothetical protein
MGEGADFEDRLESVSQLRVDVEHLRGVRIYLEELAKLVETEIITARYADRTLRLGPYEQSAFGREQIEPQVPNLKQKTRVMAEKVNTNLTNIARALTEAARTVDRIDRTYRDAAQRNRLSMAEVNRLLPRPRTPGNA